MVSSFSMMTSRKGERYARFTLEDLEDSIDAIVFAKPFERYGHLLSDDAIVKVKCFFDSDDLGSQIKVNEVIELDLVDDRPRFRPLEIVVSSDVFNKQMSDDLMTLLKRYPGSDPVILLVVQSGNRKLRAELPFTVDSDAAELRGCLYDLVGMSGVKA